MSLFEKIRLFFTKKEVTYHHEEGIVLVTKRMDGKLYILHQEPIAYGDARNMQIDYLCSFWSFRI